MIRQLRAVVAVLNMIVPAYAQTRYFTSANLGAAHSLGYRAPTYGGSFAVERPMGRLELQALAGASITRKLDSASGHSAVVEVASYWFLARFAGIGARACRNWLWTDAYNKHSIGVVPTFLLQGKMGIPTRLYAGYRLPHGCGNCAGIQSSRTRGVDMYWEGEVARRGPVVILLGHEVDLLRFKDQAPTGAPPSAWVWHTGLMYEANLRFRFGSVE